MKFNDKLVYLGEQRRDLNTYIDGLVDSGKYGLTKREMWRWLYQLQAKKEQREWLDVPTDIVKGVFKLDSYITRVRDYCFNTHKDYDMIMAGLSNYAETVDGLTI